MTVATRRVCPRAVEGEFRAGEGAEEGTAEEEEGAEEGAEEEEEEEEEEAEEEEEGGGGGGKGGKKNTGCPTASDLNVDTDPDGTDPERSDECGK